MAKAPKTKQISTREGIVTGLMLLGQISGLLAAFAISGLLFDLVFDTGPLGLTIGVVVGSLWATLTVLRILKQEIEVVTGEEELEQANRGEKGKDDG